VQWHTLDFGVVNSEVTLSGFIVPSHYDYEPWKIHTVDPFEYFESSLSSQLVAKCTRTVAPVAGKIDHDIDGRAVGNWFKEGTNGYGGLSWDSYWVGHLALAYHHVTPSTVMVSIGDYQGEPRQFCVNGNGPDPASISVATGAVEYELITVNLDWKGDPTSVSTAVLGVLLIQLVEDRKLRVEVFPGLTASHVSGFTSAAVLYERVLREFSKNK
jgi:hypothetical protein